VALVVAYHLHLKGAGGGFIGVDVFFVISGYLMTKIIWRELAAGHFGYWRFIGARAARIWPALATLIVVLFLVGAFWLPPFDLEILAEQAKAAMLFWSNQFFLERSGYNTHSADTNWLLHTWSLSLEWQFYMLYPLLLVGVVALKNRLRSLVPSAGAARWAVAVLVLLIAGSCADQIRRLAGDADGSFFLLPARAWEMLAGGVVFFVERDALGRRSAWRAVASYAGVALVLASALAIAFFRLRPVGLGPVMWLPVAGTALILWANHPHNLLLRHAALQRLGLWSYSVYLWHWPILVALRMTDLSVDHPWLTAALAAAASLVLGGLSFHYVERMVQRRRAGAWRGALKPLLTMALAGIGTLVVAATHGLDFRQRPDFYRGYRSSLAPLYFPDLCSNFKKSPEQLQMCSIEKHSRRRILVIGDSHAEHFYAWFVAHSPVSVDFFSASECPPVPNFDRIQPGYRCAEYASIAWGKARSADYDTVVVAARWATVGLDGAPYCHRADGGGCDFVSVPAKQKLVLAELRDAIERTLRAGKTVVMVAGSPEARFRVPERLAREQFWYGEPRLAANLKSLREQTAWIDPLFRELESRPGFHVVSLRDRLCDGETCRLYDAQLKRPIYLDESHFDPVWIATQADLFARFVRP
jgi:peptidoglycan/LPS O-acetylase OafA/YrhL